MKIPVSIASYRAWVGDYLKDATKRNIVLCALDAFETLDGGADVSARELAPIMDAAQCSYVRVWEIGADLLNRLAAAHPAAQGALRTMLASRKARVRFQAIALLGKSAVPRSFAAGLLRVALRDQSYQVRGKAAETAGWLGLTTLIPELQEAVRVEKHPIAKEWLTFDLTMLRDGYLLQHTEGNKATLYVNLNRAGHYWRSVPVTTRAIAKRGLEALIAEARSLP